MNGEVSSQSKFSAPVKSSGASHRETSKGREQTVLYSDRAVMVSRALSLRRAIGPEGVIEIRTLDWFNHECQMPMSE
jgi:hypothetical protein